MTVPEMFFPYELDTISRCGRHRCKIASEELCNDSGLYPKVGA